MGYRVDGDVYASRLTFVLFMAMILLLHYNAAFFTNRCTLPEKLRLTQAEPVEADFDRLNLRNPTVLRNS